MRLSAGLLILVLATSAGRAQGDRLAGRWEGTVQAPQGERKAAASFKKEAAGYTGTITGLRGDIAFKEVKVEGDKILATAEVEAQGTTIVIKYEFALAGDALKGKGEVDFNGQVFTFNYDLKRSAEAASGAQSIPSQQAAPPPQRRESVPQPVQQQARDYFAGQWKFKWLGRDSPLSTGGPTTYGLAPRSSNSSATTAGRTSTERGTWPETRSPSSRFPCQLALNERGPT